MYYITVIEDGNKFRHVLMSKTPPNRDGAVYIDKVHGVCKVLKLQAVDDYNTARRQLRSIKGTALAYNSRLELNKTVNSLMRITSPLYKSEVARRNKQGDNNGKTSI